MSEPRRALADPGPEEPRRWNWRHHKGTIAVLLALVVLLGGGALAWTTARSSLESLVSSWGGADFPGPGADPVVVEIPSGTSLSGIATLLTKAGVVASDEAFLRAARADERATTIQAGSYRLATGLPAVQALAALLDPASRSNSGFTLREGNRLDQQVAAMAKAAELPTKDFTAALKGDIGLPDWAGSNAEGFLFPDTYALGANPEAATMLRQVTSRFDQVSDELELPAAAKELGITPREAVIVASIIEKEVFLAQDRPKVARVVYNRLKKKMTLGMDSTAIYASWREGLKRTNYNLDSPYNTRVNAGLPPGPIGSPGKAALAAAVAPAEGDWIYFVTVDLNTGVTEFSSDEAGFRASVAKYRAWCAASPENKALCE